MACPPLCRWRRWDCRRLCHRRADVGARRAGADGRIVRPCRAGDAGGLSFRGEGAHVRPSTSPSWCRDGEPAVVEKVRTPDHQLPVEAVLSFRDPLRRIPDVSVRQARFGAPGSRQQTIGFPGVMEAGQGRALLGDWMRRVWSERERVSLRGDAAARGYRAGRDHPRAGLRQRRGLPGHRDRGRAGPQGICAADHAGGADAVALRQSGAGHACRAGGRPAAGVFPRPAVEMPRPTRRRTDFASLPGKNRGRARWSLPRPR